MLEAGKFELIKQGAEARLYVGSFFGRPTIVKERFSKTYRHPELDRQLTVDRMKAEVRALVRCRQAGISTPTLYFVDMTSHCLYMEHVTPGVTLRDHIVTSQHDHPATWRQAIRRPVEGLGEMVAALHSRHVVHGDLTTSNVIVRPSGDLVMIDFGLSAGDATPEDKGVDLYVLERAFLSTHPDTEDLFAALLESYRTAASSPESARAVIDKLDEVRMRGRKRTMVG